MFNHFRISYSAYHNMNPVRVMMNESSLILWSQGHTRKSLCSKQMRFLRKCFFDL